MVCHLLILGPLQQLFFKTRLVANISYIIFCSRDEEIIYEHGSVLIMLVALLNNAGSFTKKGDNSISAAFFFR
jgi:hypothetical protein